MPPSPRRLSALLLAGLLAVGTAGGCASSGPAPVHPGFLAPEALPEAERWTALESRSGAVEPSVVNREEVEAALVRSYPEDLRRRGVTGTPAVDMFVDTEGWVRHIRLARSSGHESLDAAALEVGARFRFSPARVGGEVVPVWMTIPVGFRVSP